MGSTVLVADDSKTIRTICEWVFKGTDHRLLLATAGDETLHTAEAEKPDVIVLDYTLPDQDSYELCRSLKSDPRFGPVAVLMLGGNFADFDEERATSCGADDTLIKPFRADELQSKVEELAARLAAGELRRVGAAPAAAAATAPAAPAPAEATPASPLPAATASQPASQVPQGRPASRFQFPSRTPTPPPAAAASTSASGGTTAAKRFSFPTATPAAAAASSAPPPASPFGTPRTAEPEAAAAEAATATSAAAPSAPAFDEEMMRAEIQRAVKEHLPGIVKGILKELITREVTPQLQRWVEEKVTVVAQRMLQERMR